MTITDTLELADGSSAANLFMTVNIHTGSLEVTGQAPVDLKYWRSEADKNAGKAQVWPVESGAVVGAVTLNFTGTEIVKVGGNCSVNDTFTFYKTEVANKLNALYGWTVNL
jgi:hypothetical protein